jgi:predicted membrane-bound spermidine synthase
MALGLTEPLTEISTRNISWGVKTAGAYGWQPYHLHVPCLEIWSLKLLEPSGPVQACNGIALPYVF